MKKISINTSIYELVKNDSKIGEIMYSLGFKDIINPVMLNSVGRIMNIKKAWLCIK